MIHEIQMRQDIGDQKIEMLVWSWSIKSKHDKISKHLYTDESHIHAVSPWRNRWLSSRWCRRFRALGHPHIGQITDSWGLRPYAEPLVGVYQSLVRVTGLESHGSSPRLKHQSMSIGFGYLMNGTSQANPSCRSSNCSIM